MSVSTLSAKSMSESTHVPSSESEAVTEQKLGRRFNGPQVVGLIVLSLLPFWVVPFAHVLSDASTATGFYQYELPYYVANGRAAFERGNGVVYPNPYDPSENAPAVYAHWLPWMFGAMTAKFGFDPGDVMLTSAFFASLLFALATRELVRLRTTCRSELNVAFLFAMLGGGLLCVAGMLFGVLQSKSFTESVLQFDPGQGMWFLNWGRNALFPTESIYHALVASCWIAEIRTKPKVANLFLLLLITTHPWSGIELLCTINLWRGIQFLRLRNVTSRNQLSISILALATFMAYYKIWLPSFPSHAELQSVWELNWSLSWTSAAFAYLPVLIPCCMHVHRQIKSGTLQRSEQFLLCALAVAIGLAFHDRLIKPVQPLHFTRGYVWMPMFLLGLPVVLKWLRPGEISHRRLNVTVGLLLLVLSADNLMFAAVHAHRQFTKADGFHLDTDERALLATLHELNESTGVILTDSEVLNYLLPAYANARTWLGHHFNTPQFPARKQIWQRCFAGNGVDLSEIPDDVSVLVVRATRDDASLMNDSGWRPLPLKNAEWHGWQRIR